MLIPNFEGCRLPHNSPHISLRPLNRPSQLEAALSLMEASQVVIVDHCVGIWHWNDSLFFPLFFFFFPPLQLSDQPSLEEAIRIASRIQQGESPGLDE